MCVENLNERKWVATLQIERLYKSHEQDRELDTIAYWVRPGVTPNPPYSRPWAFQCFPLVEGK